MNATEQTAESRRFEQEMRFACRQQVIAMGLPASAASEIVDLAFHATDKAMDALADAVMIGSTPMICTNALLIATSLIDIRMGQARDTANELSKMDGVKMLCGTVSVGGQPT